MLAPELDQVGAALGQAVLGSRRLAGGFSHETCLLTLPDRQVVARLGGQDPAIEAAVMAAAGRQVPVPEVVLVLPAAETGARPVMVIEYAQGTLLSEVLAGKPDAADLGAADLRALGTEVGRTSAGISAAAFERPGFFSDGTLSVGHGQPWSTQLAEFAATCMDAVPPTRLDPASRAAWAGLCARHAGALTEIDAQARLVHADLNPKNLLVMRAGDGWQVTAVLDWEFSFSGCPYADAANMVRFAADYPPGFADGFLDGFAGRQPAGLPPPRHWLYLGRVLDMFALSDLVTRPAGHGVADQAASQIRRWLDSDVPGWPLAPRPPGANHRDRPPRIWAMAADSSFDVVSKFNRDEVDNALNQTAKEIGTRFDFRGVGASIAWSGKEGVEIKANSEARATAVLDVFKEKLIKRSVSLKVLDAGEPKPSGKEYKISVSLKEGISQDDARKISKLIRDEGPKGVRAQVQGDELRVSSKKKDELQDVIVLLKGKEFDIALQFVNYR